MDREFEKFVKQLGGVYEMPARKTITESELHQIIPTWDLRPSGIFHNNCSLKNMDQCQLYLSERSQFINWLEEPELYSFESFMAEQANEKYFNVITHWKGGISLAPPIFYFDGMHLGKIDGHHRTTVTLLTRTPVVPFYSLENIEIEGIDLAPSELFISHWQAQPQES